MSIAAASAIISALGLFQKAWADGSKADREAEKDRAKLLREAAQALRILSEQAEHLLRNQDLPSFAILNIARQCRLLENLSRWADLDSEASALVRRWAGTIRVQPALLIAKSSQLSEALKGQALDDDPELNGTVEAVREIMSVQLQLEETASEFEAMAIHLEAGTLAAPR